MTDTPVTATFAVIAWSAPYKARADDTTIVVRRRNSDIYKIIFQNQTSRLAFPDALRKSLADTGGELILCQEVRGKYD